MTSKRTKKAVLQPQTDEAAQSIMAEYATADARRKELTARMDQELTDVRSKYSEDLADLNETCDEKFNALQLFAEANKARFDKKRSIDFNHGTIGFRIGTPALKLIKGFQWGAVLELLKQKAPSYVRTKEEPAKDKLLADRDQPEVASLLNRTGIGCEVVQDETFFIELKKEEASVA